MEVGDRIRAVRKEKALTQKGLAMLAGVSEMAIRKYENHDRQPRMAQLQGIAAALDVSIDWLATGSDTIVLESSMEATLQGQARAVKRDVLDAIEKDLRLLSDEGLREAAKRVHELTQIAIYQK